MFEKKIVKRPQFILAMDASFWDNVNDLVLMDKDEFLREAQEHLIYGQREKLEKDVRFRQLLPYQLFYQKDEDGTIRYLAYTRTNKGAEVKLHDNRSIGWGGHIDLADVNVDDKDHSIIDLEETLIYASNRERNEEVRFIGNERHDTLDFRVEGVDIAGFIAQQYTNQAYPTDDPPVGLVHLGLIILTPIPAGYTAYSNEAEIEKIELLSAKEMLADPRPIEDWTRIILENEEIIFAVHAENWKDVTGGLVGDVADNQGTPITGETPLRIELDSTLEVNPLYIDPEGEQPPNGEARTMEGDTFIWDAFKQMWIRVIPEPVETEVKNFDKIDPLVFAVPNDALDRPDVTILPHSGEPAEIVNLPYVTKKETENKIGRTFSTWFPAEILKDQIQQFTNLYSAPYKADTNRQDIYDDIFNDKGEVKQPQSLVEVWLTDGIYSELRYQLPFVYSGDLFMIMQTGAPNKQTKQVPVELMIKAGENPYLLEKAEAMMTGLRQELLRTGKRAITYFMPTDSKGVKMSEILLDIFNGDASWESFSTYEGLAGPDTIEVVLTVNVERNI